MAEICGKKQQNHLFQKSRNFAKSKRCRVLGPTFLDSSLHFTSKTGKNLIFNFFTQKVHFYHFCHNNLGQFCRFLLLNSKTRRFYFFMMSRKYKKTTQLMQCPFRMCKVKIYMGIPRSLWLKWQECHSCDKKTKKLFSFSQ